MDLVSVMLSRIQFGFTIGFHILFPTFNLGLALFLAIMEGVWLKTGQLKYLHICRFWTKIFALTFGMGVVSGIVMAYQFGTNFGHFIEAVGGVLGPLFAYETLSAFFLEAGFLGIMLFGWDKVGPKLHYAATLLVMIGTTISAFWILSANSWMQYPVGFDLIDGKYVVNDWLQVIFNPLALPRFTHMLFASYVTCCFVIAGIAAWYLLRQRHSDIAKTCFSFALGAALVVVPLQIIIGDEVGLNVHKYQPLKTAAMEGVWETGRGLPLLLFAIPQQAAGRNLMEVKIPYGASLINTHQLNGELIGLKTVAPADRPPMSIVFFGFRIMVGIGLLFMAMALIAAYLRWRGKLYTCQWFLKLCILAAPLGFVSAVAGWMTAESGRQPWVIYNLMRTLEGVSWVSREQVFISLSLFIVVYGIVLSFYLHYLFGLIRKGPPVINEAEQEPLPFHYMAQGGNK